MWYAHTTYRYNLVGWVGDTIGDIEPHAFADADLGGCVRAQRSTSGAYLILLVHKKTQCLLFRLQLDLSDRIV